MEQYHNTNTKTIAPALLAMLIWILTSLALGAGCFFYDILFHSNGETFMSILVAVGAGILSLPVLLVLCIAVPVIKNTNRHSVGKVNCLVLTCFLCTLPYALIAASFYADNYESRGYLTSYLLHALASCGILFSCSIVAMLITAKVIKRLFYTGDQNEFSINEIGQALNNETDK